MNKRKSSQAGTSKQMPSTNCDTPETPDSLEGTTLAVYTYVAKSRWPVGTRDVVRNLSLSSSSVAFRHLQKLDAMGLLSKTPSGEYIVKVKVRVRGNLWVGRRLLPRTLFYSFFFIVALAVEIAILLWHFEVENYEFMVFFSMLALITAVALGLFLADGLREVIRMRRKSSDPDQSTQK
jgi:hypothetical protein